MRRLLNLLDFMYNMRVQTSRPIDFFPTNTNFNQVHIVLR